MTSPSKQAFASIDEYNRFMYRWPKKYLLEQAKTAIAWGVPDRESTGYSQQELITIIRKLVEYIENN